MGLCMGDGSHGCWLHWAGLPVAARRSPVGGISRFSC